MVSFEETIVHISVRSGVPKNAANWPGRAWHQPAKGAEMKKQLLIALVAMVGWMCSAPAQVYPSRPITIVVPFAAGGPTDTLARTLAERMREPLGHTVIIENATGAGGSLGVGRVVRAAPDGYTVGIGNWSTHVVNGAIYALPYDLVNDLDPVAALPG